MNPYVQSRRLAGVQEPMIPTVARLIAETPGTISLGQGLVFWPPPPSVTEALASFSEDPMRHRYGSVDGEESLREAIVEKLTRENRVVVGPVVRLFVTAGSNMAFLNAILAICDEGDEVILQTPYYFNHEMAITMAGARAVTVPTDEAFHLDVERISQSIGPRTRAVVTVSPNNPSGAVYGEEVLRAVNALCASRGVFHIHDEAYEYFVYDGRRHFSPGSIDGAGRHTISLYSLSKAYGFASWRIGYMVVPDALTEAIRKIQDTNLICPPRVSQYAACAALQTGRAWCDQYFTSLARVRSTVRELLAGRPDLYEIGPTEGAFYAMVTVHASMPPLTLVERLVREHHVAAIPGETFGLSGCTLRLSYGALEPATVERGLRRLVDGLAAIVGR